MIENSTIHRASRILLVESHDLTRIGIRVILSEARDTACDLVEVSTLDECKMLLSEDAHVDLVLSGSGLPGTSDTAAISEIIDTAPGTAVALLSSDTDTAKMREVLDLGASGYIPKSLPSPVFRAAINLILAGGSYFPVQLLLGEGAGRPRLSVGNEGIMNTSDPTRGHVMSEGMGSFSRRQRQVLDLILKGKSNKEIARHLGISLGTAKNYVATILRLRNATSRAQLLSSFVLSPTPSSSRARVQ